MGQQQLLLIVLGVIIVGVAIVAGIGLFNAGSEEAIKDELVSQCMNIGANTQQWYKKPIHMGGGGGTFIGYDIPEKLAWTSNCGSKTPPPGNVITPGYVGSGASATSYTITATPNEGYAWTVVCTVTPEDVITVVTPNP